MAPYDLWQLFGSVGGFVAYLLIGFTFGFILESAGFGDARKLAGQFYFKDLAVVRVMMTAIITAMLLVFAASSLGLMDFQDVYVNPTYLVSGVVGGLVMGVGFVVGGYCPGTSLAAMGSGRLDAVAFVGGALAGVTVFGEVADGMARFMNAGAWGRLTLDEVFDLPIGAVVVLALLFGLGMFTLMNSVQRTVWKQGDPGFLTIGGKRLHPAVLLVPAALLLVPITARGLPDADQAYALRAQEYDVRLADRSVHVHPAELLATMHDTSIELRILDVREESAYNLFHLRDAVHVELDELDAIWSQDDVPGRVTVVVGNDETASTLAWKRLVAMKVANVYVLEGGINAWLDLFGTGTVRESVPVAQRAGDDRLAHRFDRALGDRHYAARPSHHDLDHYLEAHELARKIKVAGAGRKGGGCG